MSAENYMARAIELARKGINTSFPNPRVGCVIVKDGVIIGEGYHHKKGEPHAEVHALKAAAGRARGAVAYVTLEPCNHQGSTGPCSDALIEAEIAEVYYAVADPNPLVNGSGAQKLREAGLKVHHGLLSEEAADLNQHYFYRMRNKRPWFTLKLAMSIDGRTALANRESQWITGEGARRDVHRYRSEYHSILTGIGTVQTDNPKLTVRGEVVERQPDRILIDAWLDAPTEAHIFNQDAKVRVLCAKDADKVRIEALQKKGVEVINSFDVNERKRLYLDQVAFTLGDEEVNSVWMECGSHLASAFMQEGLVDELIVYIGNTVIGSDGFPLLRQSSPKKMDELERFTLKDVVRFDNDMRLTYLKA